LFGYSPPQLLLGHPHVAKARLWMSLSEIDITLSLKLKTNLLKVQDHMKKKMQIGSVRNTNLALAIGSPLNYNLIIKFLCLKENQNLVPSYYGPFKIEVRISVVAYRLRFPAGSAIHAVIHVLQLKKHINCGQNISPTLSILGS
jgi:hypothetical protein